MRRLPGCSVFVSRFGEARDRLAENRERGRMIFTSLHIAEEFDGTYAERACAMCRFLAEAGFAVVADVSRRSLGIFGETDPVTLAERLGVHALRIDYGFSEAEVIEMGRRMPICINASTTDAESAARIARSSVRVYGMHNYYPRPETALDREDFDLMNRRLGAAGIEALAFIPGDGKLRGPLFRGLPTLEDHRDAAPSAAYADLVLRHGVEGVFVGDGIPSAAEDAMIGSFLATGILDLPVDFAPAYRSLEGRTFTARADSPRRLLRLQESREYATLGGDVEPWNTVERTALSVTMDNREYLRYSGEIQVLKETLPADGKVNVIGRVPAPYRLVLENLKAGDRFRFVRPAAKD